MLRITLAMMQDKTAISKPLPKNVPHKETKVSRSLWMETAMQFVSGHTELLVAPAAPKS